MMSVRNVCDCLGLQKIWTTYPPSTYLSTSLRGKAQGTWGKVLFCYSFILKERKRLEKDYKEGKQKCWSLAGAGHMDWAIQWHFIGCQMEQKRCKKRSLSEPLCGFLQAANMFKRGGGAPVVADLPDKDKTAGQLAKNLERCKHF